MNYELLRDYCKSIYGEGFDLSTNFEDRGTFIEFYKQNDNREYRVSIFTLLSFIYLKCKK